MKKNHQSEEDYLESILRLGEEDPFVHRVAIAKKLEVSQAAVNKAVNLLIKKDYVYEDGLHLYLTEKGKKYAAAVYEKHCVLRKYLVSIGVSSATAEQDACKMEHVLSEETFQAIKSLFHE